MNYSEVVSPRTAMLTFQEYSFKMMMAMVMNGLRGFQMKTLLNLSSNGLRKMCVIPTLEGRGGGDT